MHNSFIYTNIVHAVAQRQKGVPEPQILWYINGTPLSQSTETSRVHANGTLIIENPNANVSGIYKCEATNYLGTVSATADVRINGNSSFFFFYFYFTNLIFSNKIRIYVCFSFLMF